MNKSPFSSTKFIELGSCAFRQWRADHSHCSYIHGYQLKAKFWFAGSSLDEKNWICDFGGLKDLKAKLHHVFDHTLCIAADDPCLDIFKELESKSAVQLRIFEKGVGIERAAELCFNIAASLITEKYGDRCWVEKVEVFEHEDNSAIYQPTIAQSNVPEKIAAVVTQPVDVLPPVTQQITPAPAPVSTAAPVGPRQTTNTYSGLFAGTRWG
jgi:6-pyruvoyltetrahydropterin/6-carboxytetrahydropterin synthase